MATGPSPSGHLDVPIRQTAVLKILQCSNLGGMEQVAYSLLDEMVKRGSHRFHITTPRPFGDGEPLLRLLDAECRDFPYKGKFGWRSFLRYRAHIHSLAQESDHIWITGTCAASLAAVKGLPHQKVLGHHFHHFDDRTSMLRWFGFYHGLCRQLDIITYPTDFTRNEALSIAPWLQSRTHVVRYGYPINYKDESDRINRQQKAREALGLPPDGFIIGNAGWLIGRKRFDVFLQTAARVRQKVPNAFFVICGGGPLEKELRQLAARLGIADAVRFTGWVQGLEEHYQSWDICLFNSDFDALGRTPMEAASYGCVAVASVKYGGLKEFLKNGSNGILIEDHDPDSLAVEIAELFRSSNKAISFRQAAVASLQRDYSLQYSLNFYRSIFC